MKKRVENFLREYKRELCMTAIFGAVVAALYLSRLGCLFHTLLGISCMSCGMTRAYVSLMHGDLGTAFFYHPLFWSMPIIYFVLFFRKKLSPRFFYIFTAVTAAVFTAVYLLRLFFIPDSLIYIGI